MLKGTGLTVAMLIISTAPMRAQEPGDLAPQDPVRQDTASQRRKAPVLDEAGIRTRDSTYMVYANNDQGSWIRIEGNVKMVGEKSFILAYEGGTVAVAMGSEELRAHAFQQDQHLTVYGRVDGDFFERKVLKARVVVVKSEEPSRHQVIGEGDAIRMINASHGSGTVVHGRVTGINGRQFTLDQADGRITVDTSTLSYDPMTSRDHLRVEVGNLVTAHGPIRSDFWSGRLLKATALDVIKLGQVDQDTGAQGMDGQEQEHPSKEVSPDVE